MEALKTFVVNIAISNPYYGHREQSLKNMNQYIFQNCQIVSKRILSLVYSQSILFSLVFFSMYEGKLYIINVLEKSTFRLVLI